MVPLFVGYALIVWYYAGRHRRRVAGAVSVALGLLGLMCLNWFHIQLGHWTRGEIYVPVLQSITYPYTVLVFIVGGFIWSLPRYTGDRCVRCRYSLEGLEPIGAFMICPECGTKHTLRSGYRRSGTDRRRFDGDDDRANEHQPGSPAPNTRGPGIRDQQRPIVIRSSAQQPPEPAGEQDGQRQPADERPSEPAETAR